MTTIYTVTWPQDGQTARISISAEHANDEADVVVSGAAAARFTNWPKRARPSLLRRQVESMIARSMGSITKIEHDEVVYADENDVK